jgi:uncharacterized oligopeptide transporter (OPT) family protein
MTSRSLPMTIVVLLGTLISATACVSTDNLKLISAGHTGCTPDKLTISNVQGFGSMWNATCNGKIYLCSGVAAGKSADFSCALAQ